MQLVGVVLLLISIGTIVGPIGAVVVMYRDNLPQLVIPAELSNGTNSLMLVSDSFSNGNSTPEQDNFLAPVFVGVEVDTISRTFSLTLNFTNPLAFNLTLNRLAAGVTCNVHNVLLGNVSIAEPVFLVSGETSQIVVSGLWTQDAETHFITQHSTETKINVNLVNIVIDVNGIIVHEAKVNVGEVSLTL